jgi:capsular exopolysaccharide synthesis family protein
MSRIHEALKKAEQERATSDNASQISPDPDPIALDARVNSAATSTGSSHMSAAAPVAVMTGDALLDRTRRTNWKPDPKTMLFFNSDEHIYGMEEFRTLRSRLYQAREKHPLSKVLVTSPLPKEGKSFVTANLGQVLVQQQGKRVLLVDADLRNPHLHLTLGAEPGPGLSDYLRSETDEFSVIQGGPMENLFLIPAGSKNENPAELVASGRMNTLLNRLQPLFDWIIVDSPPAAAVSDAALIANYCDGVLLVVRSNATPFDIAQRARQEFGDNLIGVVLNGISTLPEYSQYYYNAYGKPNGHGQAMKMK